LLEPFNRLIERKRLMAYYKYEAYKYEAYKYEGLWRAMDTIRERQVPEDLVEAGNTPWPPLSRAYARGAS
jgi:glucose-1-phosphate cytidylyltransferase